MVIDVHYVDIFELPPGHLLSVEGCDVVGRQVGDFYAQAILSFAEYPLWHLKHEGYRPRTAYLAVVHADTGTLPDVAEVDLPGLPRLFVGFQAECTLIDSRAHQLCGLCIEAFPGLQGVE